MNEIFSFEKQKLWQAAVELARDVYVLSERMPLEDQLGLRVQIRRAAVSVVTSMAKGLSRRGRAEQVHFADLAHGHLMEVFSQLVLARKLGFLKADETRAVRRLIVEIAEQLDALGGDQQAGGGQHLQTDTLFEDEESALPYFVHETATVDEGAVIGEGTCIWHYTHVMSGAVIGKECTLGQNVFVAKGVVLGDHVKVQNNVSVYEGVVCEDDVFLGPSMVFTNVLNPRSAVPRKDAFLPTHVRRGATIGANATVVCGHEIGAYAFVGAGAVVTRDVPPYALVVGNPIRQIGWMSRHGLRLHFDATGRAICPESGLTYYLSEGRVRCSDGEDTAEKKES